MSHTEVKWLGGFTSADGTISPMIKKQRDVNIGYYLSLRMSWNQKSEPILAGFFDGDGYINPIIKRKGRGYSIRPTLQMGNRCSLILIELSSILNGLNIEYRWGFNKRDEMIYININKFSHVKNLLEILFPYLLGSKRIQAEIMLREIIPRMERSLHRTKEGFLEIMEFVDRLNSHKVGKRGKYNRKFFIGVWRL